MSSQQHAPSTSVERRALVMVSDPEHLDVVLRLAAAAGCEVQRVLDTTQARQHWLDAPLILVDEPAAQACAEAALPRRRGVVTVCGDPPPPEVWRHAVAVGAEHVVALPQAESWLVAAFTEAAEGRTGDGVVVAVIGGRGGAGASVLSAVLAMTAVRDGGHALLVDCDPLGGGLDLVLGAEDLGGLRWPRVKVGGGRIPATALHAALPAPEVTRRGAGALAVLSCDRTTQGPTPGAVAAVLESGRRAGETVVCDLPRYPTEAAAAVLGGADLTVVVVPADVRSCAAAGRVAEIATAHGANLGLVVRGPAPGGVAPTEIAATLRLPLLAAMRPEPGLARALESGDAPGKPHGPLVKTARIVLAEATRTSGGQFGASA